MAKNQPKTEASTETVAAPTTHRGRKPGQESNPENSAKRLSAAVSRAAWYLTGSPSSAVGTLAARAARAGISRERVERGFALIQAELELARTQMEAAYAAPRAKEQRERPNVSL